MIEPVRVQRSALLLHHQGMLATSGISDDVVLERQYVSVTEKAMLERLGFSTAQRIVPGLLIPLWSVTGEVAGYQYRPDLPRTRGGRAIKYETRPKPYGSPKARRKRTRRCPTVSPAWTCPGCGTGVDGTTRADMPPSATGRTSH
jgi:hypothetical protein